jgi:hypothetical protein
MVSAGVTFTNDRYPRAATPDLSALLSSDPDETTERTLVRSGATIGARAVIGPGITIGRYAMIGMGSVVTRDVPDHCLVHGHPARPQAMLCRCGKPLLNIRGSLPECHAVRCSCGDRYEWDGQRLQLGTEVA